MHFSINATLLDGCVLAVLEQGNAYGYSLTQRLRQEIDISESTLYPVLRRLQKDNCLTVYDEQFQGRNRRYYSITPTGRNRLAEYRVEWRNYRAKIDHILVGGMQDG